MVKQRLTGSDRFGTWPASPLVQTLVLSLVLQAYVLAAPFYMQLAVDEGVVNDDRGLLSVFALGLRTRDAVQRSALDCCDRASWSTCKVGFAFDLGNGLFRHLLRCRSSSSSAGT